MSVAGIKLVDGNAWKLAITLRGVKKFCGPLESPGRVAYTAADKAELFVDCMEDQFQPNEEIVDEVHIPLE